MMRLKFLNFSADFSAIPKVFSARKKATLWLNSYEKDLNAPEKFWRAHCVGFKKAGIFPLFCLIFISASIIELQLTARLSFD